MYSVSENIHKYINSTQIVSVLTKSIVIIYIKYITFVMTKYIQRYENQNTIAKYLKTIDNDYIYHNNASNNLLNWFN